MSWFLAFAGFALLIILHEFGHFAAAKLTGMRVERFALFFPPLILKWKPKNSETTFASCCRFLKKMPAFYVRWSRQC